MPKYKQFAAMLEKRILRGDYTLDGLPTEQELANEVGVSRMTARRALRQLMDDGIIVRKPHGRPTINAQHHHLEGKTSLAILTPAYSSLQYANWTHATERVAAELDMRLRVVHYVHWNDPVIPQSLASFDGVFLVPGPEKVPSILLKWFSEAKNLVVLDGNLTECGVPSLVASQEQLIQRIGDHLYDLGHRQIDMLNTQPHDRSIEERLLYWAKWKRRHDVRGNVLDLPVEPYTEPTAKAHSIMKKVLEEKSFTATALVCLTTATAAGAMRAMHENGIGIGQDVSVCSIDGAKVSRFMIPSCTAFEHRNFEPSLKKCMEWLASGEEWDGPLHIHHGESVLFKGESTGPARREAS